MKCRDPKPKHSFCWECSLQLYGKRWHDVVVCDGAQRIVHGGCAKEMLRSGRATRPEEVKP